MFLCGLGLVERNAYGIQQVKKEEEKNKIYMCACEREKGGATREKQCHCESWKRERKDIYGIHVTGWIERGGCFHEGRPGLTTE